MKRKGMSPKSIDPVTQLVPGEWDRGITLITDIWVYAYPSILVLLSRVVATSPRKSALLLIPC
jgi:hypothetical protein